MALKEKLSISIDRDVAQRIRQRTGPGGVSDWLNEAALLRLQGAILDDLAIEYGPLPAELLNEIERSWPEVG